MAITSERLHQMVFDSVTDVRTKFIVEALAALLESQVGAGAVDDILDELIPVSINAQATLFGHKLGDFMGLDRTTIKLKFKKPDGSALSDADVDDIFEAAGITAGTSTPNPMGANADVGPKEAEADKKEVKEAKAEGKPDAAPKPTANPNQGKTEKSKDAPTK